MSSPADSTTDGAFGDDPPPTDSLERARAESAVAHALFGESEPATVARFRILARIGRGGMGVVYSAWDPSLQRRVALKLVHSASDPRLSHRRLLAEARAAARLSHPNVVTVHEVGQAADRVFIAMEYVDGVTLDAALGQHAAPSRVLELYRQAGRGLAAAHAAGLVHRDFKPANVLVAREVSGEERVRVADFGLARVERVELAEHATTQDQPLDLSATGALLGTPAYMSPEQLSGEVADARSDQFSFCVALYEALYGAPPFSGGSVLARLEQITQGLARMPPSRAVPRRVALAIRRGLALHPGDRFADMNALLAALDVRRSRTRWAVISAFGLAAMFGVAAAMTPGERVLPCADMDAPWRESVGALAEPALRRIETSGMPSADTLGASARGSLDRYAHAWTATRTEVCEATHVSGTQSDALLDLRMHCLDRRRMEAHALLHRLQDAKGGELALAVDAIEGLEAPEGCRSSTSRSGFVAPDEPDRAAEYEAIVSELAELRTDFALSQWKRGQERGRAIAERARAAALPGLWAQATSRLSAFEARLGDPAVARSMAEEALSAAVTAEWPALASEVATGLVWIDGYLLGDHVLAERDGALALAWLAAIGDPPDARASVLDNLGINAARMKDYALAEARHREAMALATRDTARVRIAVNLGVALARQHRPDARAELDDLMQGTLVKAEALYGPDNPMVAALLHNMASAESTAEACPGAIPLLERALSIKRANYGAEGLALASTHTSLANCHGVLHNPAGALEHLGRAIEIVERKLGPDHARLLSPLLALAVQHIEMGALDRAEVVLDRTQAIQEASYGADDPGGYDIIGVRAALWAARGDRAREQQSLLRALELALRGDPAPGAIADLHLRLASSLAAAAESIPG